MLVDRITYEEASATPRAEDEMHGLKMMTQYKTKYEWRSRRSVIGLGLAGLSNAMQLTAAPYVDEWNK